ncbi:helix-turn-helix transcriptional regulator [Halalkalicoccus salilacus]|uniref:helix-turn-helix transcriptional regulator n=1 Tax=Halalkalicoccus sp. GCM10025704 TaxID=3252662 RepID=UPI0036222AA7
MRRGAGGGDRASTTETIDTGRDDRPTAEASRVGPNASRPDRRGAGRPHARIERGRMRQTRIVERTDWSKSKVSMLLSEMEADGALHKLRVGRENIISLPGAEPVAARPGQEREP